MKQRIAFAFVALAAFAASGCGIAETTLLNPKGPVGLTERDLLTNAFLIMLIVVIPVIVMAFAFAWRYRAGNPNATYAPHWTYSWKLDAVVWAVPALIIIALGIHVWVYSHRLDPYKALASSREPLEVHVVAQDWKWLFLYPEQNVASVNQLAFPSGVPLKLKITSDTVMNSFFVPGLGGQIYAMAGMQTQLNLLADAPGTFTGRNTQYSGDGFSDQYFQALAMTGDEFNAWVEKARAAGATLDAGTYNDLAKPSSKHPVTLYSAYEPGLFQHIIGKYAHSEGTHR